MKFLKHLDVKNNKVLLGLFTLLFLGSLVQTSAILKTRSDLNTTQGAQVTSATAVCLTVTPSSSVIEPIFYPDNSPAPYQGNEYSYMMNFRIRNTCPYAIKLVNPASYYAGVSVPYSSLRNTGVQAADGTFNPVNVNVASNVYGIQAVTELFSCVACESGASTYHSYPQGPSTGQQQINVFNLNAGQSRNIRAVVVLKVPNNPSTFIRTKLNSLNWFRGDTALADGVVQNSEINTATFTSAFSNGSATSYLRAQRPVLGSGMVQEGTKDVTTKPETKTPTVIKQ